MKTCSEEQFFAWGKENGIEVVGDYATSTSLSFKPDSGLERFWATPIRPERRPHFLYLMLRLMGECDSYFVWRHMGSWPAAPDPNDLHEKIEFHLLRSVGLPMGTTEVVQFDGSEFVELVTLLLTTTVFGWSVGEDLYIVPDHARYIMKTSHHDVVYVSFRRQLDLDSYVQEMAKADFPLPTGVPDGTFSIPDWMQNHS